MLDPKLEEKLYNARRALERATSEQIIELCKRYLASLAEYRDELYKLPGLPGLELGSEPPLSTEDADRTRKETRIAIEHITQERNRTAALLLSITAVSGYEAVATFNRRKYQGYNNWELRAGGVRSVDSADDRMTIQAAVDMASLIRREEYIFEKAANARRELSNASSADANVNDLPVLEGSV